MRTTKALINQFLPISMVMVIALCSSLILSGCFGSDGDDDVVDDGGGSGTAVAFNFTRDNTETAAKLAANTISFFPSFSEVSHTVITTLAIPIPNNAPFDLTLCANAGSSMLSWNDADDSGDLTAGDSARLTYTDCDIDGIATGTVDFVFSSADLDPPPNQVASTVTLNLSITDAPDTTTYTANFEADWSTIDNNVFISASKANDLSGQKITATENGIQLYQFGCFEVIESYSPGTPGTYGLAPVVGVINSDNKIMSLAGGPPLTFVNDLLESGTKRVLSLAIPECASVGVPAGVGDSDGSYIDIEAQSGGYVRLHTYDNTDAEFYTLDTSWDALLLD